MAQKRRKGYRKRLPLIYVVIGAGRLTLEANITTEGFTSHLNRACRILGKKKKQSPLIRGIVN